MPYIIHLQSEGADESYHLATKRAKALVIALHIASDFLLENAECFDADELPFLIDFVQCPNRSDDERLVTLERFNDFARLNFKTQINLVEVQCDDGIVEMTYSLKEKTGKLTDKIGELQRAQQTTDYEVHRVCVICGNYFDASDSGEEDTCEDCMEF